jgi:hypothetical protein
MYQALVLLHLVGVVIFAAAHGVSMFVAFQVRRETDRRVMRSLLGLSKRAVILLYAGLLMLAIGGFGAAASTGVLLAPWAIASYAVLAVIVMVMWFVGTTYYVDLRTALADDGPDAADPAVIQQTLATRRPEILLVAGSIGMLVLLWLMVVRPS